MKKIVFVILLALTSGLSYAQLGAPKITVRDTFAIVACFYNETELALDDWPATFIEEDALNVYVADYKYKKGKAVKSDIDRYVSSWGGNVDYYKYNSICNGKTENLVIIRPREDCDKFMGKYPFKAKYTIGDYEFYTISREDMRLFISSILESQGD